MAGRALFSFLRSVVTGEETEDSADGEAFVGDLAVMFHTFFQEWGRRTPVPRKGKGKK